MKNQTVHPTQDTKAGTSETESLRLRSRPSKIKEVEAAIGHDGKITYIDDTGKEKAYIIDSTEDFKFAVGECQLTGKKNIEVSDRLFDYLTNHKDTPYLIYSTPAVTVFRHGTMDKIQQLESLGIDDLNELRSKKAQKEAAIERERVEKIKAGLEL